MTSNVVIDYAEPLHRLFTTDKRIKIVVGGRGSTKSTGVADYVVANISNGALWCCARELQNSIEESVHRLMLDEIDRLGLEGFSDTKSNIRHTSGGRNFYRGLSRNITSLQSMFTGIDGLWIEEGQSLSEDTLRVLTASVRLSAKDTNKKMLGEEIKFPEIIITMNRGSKADPISQRYLARAENDLALKGWYEDDLLLVVQCNYTDIPKKWFMSSGLEQERADDEKNMSPAQYRSKWLGDYMDEVENALIPQEWFDAAIDAHEKKGFKPRGVKVCAHDPSDLGKDAKGLAIRHGSVVTHVAEYTDADVNDGCDWATDTAIKYKVDLFTWDADGLGAGLKRQIADSLKGKRIDHKMFKGGSVPERPKAAYEPLPGEDKGQKKTNREMFFNKRAQYYWELRNRFYATYRAVEKGEYIDPDKMISIDSQIGKGIINKLRAEVCRVPRKHHGNGVIQIMTKKEMRDKYKIPSPNMADCLAMCFDTPIIDEADHDDSEDRYSQYASGGWMS